MDSIDNPSLIENGLAHIEFEFSRDEPSFFRIARESHQVLYRSMIECLSGTANLAVVSSSRDTACFYDLGEGEKAIEKKKVKGCKNAWRYSVPIDAPKFRKQKEKKKNREYLIPFYQALAMVQAKAYMCHFTETEPVTVNDEELKKLEFLHDSIRNDYEHFIPKTFYATEKELINLSILALNKSEALLFESRAILCDNHINDLKPKFEGITNYANKALEEISRSCASRNSSA